jgi:hypothetical protein
MRQQNIWVIWIDSRSRAMRGIAIWCHTRIIRIKKALYSVWIHAISWVRRQRGRAVQKFVTELVVLGAVLP